MCLNLFLVFSLSSFASISKYSTPPLRSHFNIPELILLLDGKIFGKSFKKEISLMYSKRFDELYRHLFCFRWIMYSKITMVVPMLYSTTILGAISDRFQRKLPMIIPATGVLVSCLWLMALALIPNINVSS